METREESASVVVPRRDAQGPTHPARAGTVEIAKTAVATSEADDRSVCERRRPPRDA